MRRAMALVAIGLTALVAVNASSANTLRVVQVKGVDVSVPPTYNQFFSDACGFPVYHQATGYRNTTLFYDGNGVLLRQTDVYPTMQWSLTAPQYGTTWSWGAAATTTEMRYSDGAWVGAPVSVTLTGRQGKNAGFQPDAGRRVYEGHIVGFDGIVPLWDGIYTADLVSIVGVWGSNGDPALTEAECAGLAGT